MCKTMGWGSWVKTTWLNLLIFLIIPNTSTYFPFKANFKIFLWFPIINKRSGDQFHSIEDLGRLLANGSFKKIKIIQQQKNPSEISEGLNVQRRRDSNPRYLSVQRFSRPPRSTTLPLLWVNCRCWIERTKVAALSFLAKPFSSFYLYSSLFIDRISTSIPIP